MRIVLDTNVFVSGVFWDGPPNRILKAWIAEKITLVLSLEILEEYQRIGHSLSLKYPLIDFPQVLTLLEANAEIVVSPKHHIRVCEDPDDDKFFSCALTAHVPWIVSGDKHLLKVSNYHGIQVVKPKEFLTRHLPKS